MAILKIYSKLLLLNPKTNWLETWLEVLGWRLDEKKKKKKKKKAKIVP